MSGQENLNDPSEFHHPLLLPLKQMKENQGNGDLIHPKKDLQSVRSQTLAVTGQKSL